MTGVWLKIVKRGGVAAVLGMTVAAQAQPVPNNVAQGKQLAEELCARCHVIDPSGKRGWTDAPSFPSIANRPGTTVPTLSTFLQGPHMHMLNDQRPKNEADALAAYIVSLRNK